MDKGWRKPYETERQNMLKYFEIQHKYSANWFFSIWIGIGWFAIAGWCFAYLQNFIKNGFDIAMTIMLPVCMFIVYLFFIKLGHKLRDDWSCRELNAVKDNKAVLYETSVIEFKRLCTGSNNGHRKYNYYVVVEIEFQSKIQVVSIKIPKSYYVQMRPGDLIVVFNPDVDNKYVQYLSAYPVSWLSQKFESEVE